MLEIEEAPEFTGFVLCVPGPDGATKMINVTEQEYLRHRQLLPCVSRRAETKVISKWDIF